MKAKDYDNEGIDREIKRNRPSTNPVCAALGDLGHFQVAEGYPDPRGWTVRSADGRDVGTVRDLIVDTGSMRTRYLAVRLNDYFTTSTGTYDVLVPIGTARLDDKDDVVLVNGLTAAGFVSLPAYEARTLTREQEHDLRGHFTTGEAMSSGAIGPGAIAGGEFYDHEHFDDRQFFSRGRDQTEGERRGDVEVTRPRTDAADQRPASEKQLAADRQPVTEEIIVPRDVERDRKSIAEEQREQF